MWLLAQDLPRYFQRVHNSFLCLVEQLVVTRVVYELKVLSHSSRTDIGTFASERTSTTTKDTVLPILLRQIRSKVSDLIIKAVKLLVVVELFVLVADTAVRGINTVKVLVKHLERLIDVRRPVVLYLYTLGMQTYIPNETSRAKLSNEGEGSENYTRIIKLQGIENQI